MVVGHAKGEKLFSSKLIPSTSTLYNWINRGIMKTQNIDLLEKTFQKPRNDSPTNRENRQVLGLLLKSDQLRSKLAKILDIGRSILLLVLEQKMILYYLCSSSKKHALKSSYRLKNKTNK